MTNMLLLWKQDHDRAFNAAIAALQQGNSPDEDEDALLHTLLWRRWDDDGALLLAQALLERNQPLLRHLLYSAQLGWPSVETHPELFRQCPNEGRNIISMGDADHRTTSGALD